MIIGDYANGNGIKYDKSAGKFSVKGTIESGSLIPFSNIRNGLGQDGNNNNFNFLYTTSRIFPRGNKAGRCEWVMKYRLFKNDDFIPCRHYKSLYFKDMGNWANCMGEYPLQHTIVLCCYDANKKLY